MTQSQPKVLLVEDEVIVALDLADALRHDYGMEVMLAHTLKEAVRMASENSFDFAVLDLNLGHNERSTGLGQSLASNGTRVVYMTGYNRIEIDEPHDYVVVEKPFEHRAIYRALYPLGTANS